jgi:hypothetical protein
MLVKARRALLLARLRMNCNPFIAEWLKVQGTDKLQLIDQVNSAFIGTSLPPLQDEGHSNTGSNGKNFLRQGDATVKLTRLDSSRSYSS